MDRLQPVRLIPRQQVKADRRDTMTVAGILGVVLNTPLVMNGERVLAWTENRSSNARRPR